MTALALVLYVVAVVVLFLVRSWVQHRRTGSTGFRGLSGTPADAGWWAECSSSLPWRSAWPVRCWP
jgi:hypothetical protein